MWMCPFCEGINATAPPATIHSGTLILSTVLVGIKMDAKFLPAGAGTGLFKWARKSRILLTKKFPVLFLLLSGLFVPGPNSLRISRSCSRKRPSSPKHNKIPGKNQK